MRESFFEAESPEEAEAILDEASMDDRFWEILRKGALGKMTCQEIGYEVLSRFEALQEKRIETQAEMKRIGDADSRRKQEQEGAA